MEKRIMKGNEAMAEGAIRGGCRFYAGYPITPQSEILQWMSWRQKEVGGVFIQGASEIESVNMTFAARCLGSRAFTSTSGPGFSLYQEGIAYWVSAEIPCVVACVQRFGIGDGFISAGQDNYWQAVKCGGNGDYHLIVLAPNSVQESCDMAYEAFELAEKYRHPVCLLSDGTIGQMMEPVVLPEMKEYGLDDLDWTISGVKPGEDHKVATDVTYFEPVQEWNHKYLAKMRKISEEEQRWESFRVEDADVVLVAYGISSRVAQEAVTRARTEGFKLGLIRPITLWPFPSKAFDAIPETCKGIVTVEVNMMGQMREDVIIHTKGKFNTYAMTVDEPRIHTVDEVMAFAKEVFEGKDEEEVY